ncbi:caspase family protein [Tardiphaga sp. 841_E9_N1_2]|uniref:caspase family protein n=1 Tax=Tardiphaga sp. 841_E9_N1_2 TaxID=3240762 RepID=UPI003F29EC2F
MMLCRLAIAALLAFAAVNQAAAADPIPKVVKEYASTAPLALMANNPLTKLEQELYSKSFAILIGESAYQPPFEPLLNSPKELASLAQALKDHNFNVKVYQDLSASQIRLAMDQFVADVGLEADARIVIYFAGHGKTRDDHVNTDPMAADRETRKVGYFIPFDTPTVASEDSKFVASVVRFSEIEEWAEALAAKHVLTILDSCFSGALLEGQRSAPETKIVYPKHAVFQKPVQSRVRHYVTSGTAGETVPAVSSLNATFVKALRGELGSEQADFNNDGFVTGRELFNVIQIRALAEANTTPRQGWSRTQGMRDGDIIFKIASEVSEPTQTPNQDVGQSTTKFTAECPPSCSELDVPETKISLEIPKNRYPSEARLECMGADGLTLLIRAQPKVTVDGKAVSAAFKAWKGSGTCNLRTAWVLSPNADKSIAGGPNGEVAKPPVIAGSPRLNVGTFQIEGLGLRGDQVFDIRSRLETSVTAQRRSARDELALILAQLKPSDITSLVVALPNSSYRVALGVMTALSKQKSWTTSDNNRALQSLKVVRIIMNNDASINNTADAALAKLI